MYCYKWHGGSQAKHICECSEASKVMALVEQLLHVMPQGEFTCERGEQPEAFDQHTIISIGYNFISYLQLNCLQCKQQLLVPLYDCTVAQVVYLYK